MCKHTVKAMFLFEMSFLYLVSTVGFHKSVSVKFNHRQQAYNILLYILQLIRLEITTVHLRIDPHPCLYVIITYIIIWI